MYSDKSHWFLNRVCVRPGETWGAAHTFKDLYFRKATESGAAGSPDSAAKPSGSCSSLVREAAALDS